MAIERFPLIGMSIGNSRFNEETILHLLQRTYADYGKVGIIIPDFPAIANFEAMGYTPIQARRKAKQMGRTLRNRVNRSLKQLEIEQTWFPMWENDIEPHPLYQNHYRALVNLYHTNPLFQSEVQAAMESIFKIPNKTINHFLIAEIAAVEFTYELYGNLSIIYHKPFPIFERYIAGHYDGVLRSYLIYELL